MKPLEETIIQLLEDSAVDQVIFDVPLFIRLLEYAKEDAKTDMDLHEVSEKAIKLCKSRGCLTMKDYAELVR